MGGWNASHAKQMGMEANSITRIVSYQESATQWLPLLIQEP